MSHFEPVAIYPANDWTEIAGPVRGVNATTGVSELFHGTVTAFITLTSGSDTPIAGLSVSCPEIGSTAKYGVQFDAAALTTGLGALTDGTLVYRVIKATNDFRVEAPLTVRLVRPSE